MYLQRGRSSVAPVHNLGDPIANPLCTAGELGVRIQDVELVSLMQKVLVPEPQSKLLTLANTFHSHGQQHSRQLGGKSYHV